MESLWSINLSVLGSRMNLLMRISVSTLNSAIHICRFRWYWCSYDHKTMNYLFLGIGPTFTTVLIFIAVSVAFRGVRSIMPFISLLGVLWCGMHEVLQKSLPTHRLRIGEAYEQCHWNKARARVLSLWGRVSQFSHDGKPSSPFQAVWGSDSTMTREGPNS